jgi:membrane-associated phospholipid phosphatase
MRKNILPISSLAVLAVCILCYFYVDRPVAVYCHGLGKSIKAAGEMITAFGVSTWYLVVSAVVFLLFRFVRKNEAWSNRALMVFLAVALSGIVTDIIKFVMGRARPTMLFEKDWFGFDFFQTKWAFVSFPSGHATTVAAMAFALYFIFPKYKVLYILAVLLGMASRLVLGAHYPSDVIFGAYVGSMTAILVKRVLESRGFRAGFAGKIGSGGGADEAAVGPTK